MNLDQHHYADQQQRHGSQMQFFARTSKAAHGSPSSAVSATANFRVTNPPPQPGGAAANQTHISSIQQLVNDYSKGSEGRQVLLQGSKSDPKFQQLLQFEGNNEGTLHGNEQSADRFRDLPGSFDQQQLINQQKLAYYEESFGLIVDTADNQNLSFQESQKKLREQQAQMEMHTLSRSPSGRVTGKNMQQFQNNPKLLMLQMYETEKQNKFPKQGKPALVESEIRSGESKPNQYFNNNSRVQSGLFNTQDMQAFVQSRRLLNNLSISPTMQKEQRMTANLMAKIQSQDSISKPPGMLVGESSPYSSFHKASDRGSYQSQERFANISQLQRIDENHQTQYYMQNAPHASQSSFHQSSMIMNNREAMYSNVRQMLKKGSKNHDSGVAKGAMGPMPSNTSLNGVGIKFSKRNPSPSKNEINRRIQANISPKSIPVDLLSSNHNSVVGGWHQVPTARQLNMNNEKARSIGRDLDHMSGPVSPKHEGTIHEFFDSKSFLTKSYIGDKPSIKIHNEEAHDMSFKNNHPKETLRFEHLAADDPSLKNEAVDENQNKSKETSLKLSAQPENKANILNEQNQNKCTDDGIQSGLKNLSNQYEIANEKDKQVFNNTLSSIGAGKEYKQENEQIQNQTVSNGFKITDANFMTMRENRPFGIGRSILPEPSYENRDLQGPFKIADMNITTTSKFARRRMTHQQLQNKSGMNISINLTNEQPAARQKELKTFMQSPQIIKNESIEIVTSQNKSMKKQNKTKKQKLIEFSAKYDPKVLVQQQDPIAAEESQVINQAVNQLKEFQSLQNRFGYHRMSNSLIAQNNNRQSQKSIKGEGSGTNRQIVENGPNTNEQSNKAGAVNQQERPSLSKKYSMPFSDIFSKFNATRQTSLNNSRHGNSFLLNQTLQSKLGQINNKKQEVDQQQPTESARQIQERLLVAPLTVNKLAANVPKRAKTKRPKKYQNGILVENNDQAEDTNNGPSTEQPKDYSFQDPSARRSKRHLKNGGANPLDQGVIIMNNGQIGDDPMNREEASPISTKYGANVSQRRLRERGGEDRGDSPYKRTDRDLDSPLKRGTDGGKNHSSKRSGHGRASGKMIFQTSFYSNKTMKKSNQKTISISPSMRANNMNKDLEREFSQSTFEGQRHQILANSSQSSLSQQYNDDKKTLEQNHTPAHQEELDQEELEEDQPIDREMIVPEQLMNQTFQSPMNSNNGSMLESLKSKRSTDDQGGKHEETQQDRQQNPKTLKQQVNKQKFYSTITDMKLMNANMQQIASKTVIGKMGPLQQQLNDTSHSIFIIPHGTQFTSAQETPINNYRIVETNVELTQEPTGGVNHNSNQNSNSDEGFASSDNQKPTPIQSILVPMNQKGRGSPSKMIYKQNGSHNRGNQGNNGVKERLQRGIPTGTQNKYATNQQKKQQLNKNFNLSGDHMSLKDEVYIPDQNEEEEEEMEDQVVGHGNTFVNNDMKKESNGQHSSMQQNVEMIHSANYNIISQDTNPEERKMMAYHQQSSIRKNDINSMTPGSTVMINQKFQDQIQQQIQQTPLMQAKVDQDRSYFKLEAIQDLDSYRDLTLKDETNSPIRTHEGTFKIPNNFHDGPSSGQLHTIKEKVNKTNKSSPKNNLQNKLRINTDRDRLASLPNKGGKEVYSPGLSPSPSPTIERSPNGLMDFSHKRRRDMNLNEMLFYTTQKMSVRGNGPSSLSRKKELIREKSNKDLQMSYHDLNKIQRVKNIKISFQQRNSNQITTNFILPTKTVDQQPNPFRQKREPSPEDLEMRRKLYGNTQSRDKLHKFMQQKTKKEKVIHENQEGQKAPLRINNINLQGLGNQQSSPMAKQMHNREILNQMESILHQGLIAPSTVLNCNSRILLQQQRNQSSNHAKTLTLETRKKRFLRNYKQINPKQVDTVPSFSHLPSDINEKLKRNGIMLNTKSKSMIRTTHLESSRNIKLKDDRHYYKNFLSTDQSNNMHLTSLNMTKDKMVKGLTPKNVSRKNFNMSRISVTDIQNQQINMVTASNMNTSRLRNQQSRTKLKKNGQHKTSSESQGSFLQTSRARITQLNMSALNQRVTYNRTQQMSPVQQHQMALAGGHPAASGHSQLMQTLNITDHQQIKQQDNQEHPNAVGHQQHIKIKEFEENNAGADSFAETVQQQFVRATSNLMSKASDSFMGLDSLTKKQFSTRYKRNSVGGFIHFPAREKPLMMPAIFSNQTLQGKTAQNNNDDESQPSPFKLFNIKDNSGSAIRGDMGSELADPDQLNAVPKDLPKKKKKMSVDKTKKKKRESTFLPNIY